MDWLSLALAGLKLVNLLLSWRQEARQFDAGEKAQIAKGLAETAKLSGAFKEIDEAFARMSDEDVLKKAAADGDLRD